MCIHVHIYIYIHIDLYIFYTYIYIHNSSATISTSATPDMAFASICNRKLTERHDAITQSMNLHQRMHIKHNNACESWYVLVIYTVFHTISTKSLKVDTNSTTISNYDTISTTSCKMHTNQHNTVILTCFQQNNVTIIQI